MWPGSCSAAALAIPVGMLLGPGIAGIAVVVAAGSADERMAPVGIKARR